ETLNLSPTFDLFLDTSSSIELRKLLRKQKTQKNTHTPDSNTEVKFSADNLYIAELAEESSQTPVTENQNTSDNLFDSKTLSQTTEKKETKDKVIKTLERVDNTPNLDHDKENEMKDVSYTAVISKKCKKSDKNKKTSTAMEHEKEDSTKSPQNHLN
ncbi:11462_t:CDS:2, partial [Scutellospora calospora]